MVNISMFLSYFYLAVVLLCRAFCALLPLFLLFPVLSSAFISLSPSCLTTTTVAAAVPLLSHI